jgi:hypothetical protein
MMTRLGLCFWFGMACVQVAGEEGKGRAELELEIRVVRSQDPVKVLRY